MVQDVELVVGVRRNTTRQTTTYLSYHHHQQQQQLFCWYNFCTTNTHPNIFIMCSILFFFNKINSSGLLNTLHATIRGIQVDQHRLLLQREE